MVEINITDSINENVIMSEPPEKIENIFTDKIRDALLVKMVEALNNMAFVDMEYNEEKSRFDIEASIVLCSSQDMASSVEIQAQKLKDYGLTGDQILDVLTTGIDSLEGF